MSGPSADMFQAEDRLMCTVPWLRDDSRTAGLEARDAFEMEDALGRSSFGITIRVRRFRQLSRYDEAGCEGFEIFLTNCRGSVEESPAEDELFRHQCWSRTWSGCGTCV